MNSKKRWIFLALRMKNNQIKLNKKKAIEICKAVLHAYQNKGKFFAHPNIEGRMLPEKQLVSVLPEEKKPIWLFFSCLGDKLVDSTDYYRQFRDFYKEKPDFFYLTNLKDKPLFSHRLENELLRMVNLAMPDDFIHFAVSNGEKLAFQFNGNPLNSLKNDDFKSNVNSLKKFLGYGTGLSTLYLIFLDRYGIKKTKYLVPKIDRHMLKISVGCGIASIKEGTRADSLTEKLSRLYEEVCNENGFDALLLDPTMWAIGHELCSKNDLAFCRTLCPLDNYCNKKLPRIKRNNTRLYNGNDKRTQVTFGFDVSLK